jgi:isocitrate dehydrogenase
MIIDIGTARMASRPERFDVMVTPNLYGDILSDVAAEVAGSIGLAARQHRRHVRHVRSRCTAPRPDIAGKDIANPSRPAAGRR